MKQLVVLAICLFLVGCPSKPKPVSDTTLGMDYAIAKQSLLNAGAIEKECPTSGMPDDKSYSIFELLNGETYMIQVDSKTGCIDRLLHDDPHHTENRPGDYVDVNSIILVK